MAIITRGPHDERVSRIGKVLEEYERQHPGAIASLYRQNSASIRVRVVDDRFAEWAKAKRHDHILKFLRKRLDAEDLEEVSLLLLLPRGEQQTSFMNQEFEDPIPSRL